MALLVVRRWWPLKVTIKSPESMRTLAASRRWAVETTCSSSAVARLAMVRKGPEAEQEADFRLEDVAYAGEDGLVEEDVA